MVFRCDFESYRRCGLEQQQDDELDWELIQSERRVDNVPDVDHTLGTRQGQSHRMRRFSVSKLNRFTLRIVFMTYMGQL